MSSASSITLNTAFSGAILIQDSPTTYTNSLLTSYNSRTPTAQILLANTFEVDVNVIGAASSSVSPYTDIANWLLNNSIFLTFSNTAK
jgi:hypothetical protein